MSATCTFLPWVRQGAATAIRDAERPGLPANAVLSVGLELGDGERLEIPLRLYGPGDVTGIDRRQVIRTAPVAGEDDFPPALFPLVEFDRPDFPWLFTPAKAGENGRLRPWLVLVAVRDRDGVTLRPGTGAALPVLEIRSPADPAAELPDLGESWAWVHTQVVHGAGGVEEALLGQPERTLSRLLCPRRLEPRTRYRACLVPAFEVGRLAGLGLAADGNPGTAPAWTPGDGSVVLPVYHQWSFTTGEAGDFEAAAARLRPLGALPAGLGARKLHVDDAGISTLPSLGTLDFAGVFRVPSLPPALLPDPGSTAPADVARKYWAVSIAPLVEGGADANVALPLYGGLANGIAALPAGQGWVRDLNLDPRNRAAAGLGVLFVQWHQEALMQATWEQLGDAQQAAALLRQGELALEVGRGIHLRRFAPLEARAELFFQATSPAHARVLASGTMTVAGWAEAQRLPAPATIAAFRRAARPHGPVARRLRTAGAPGAEPVALREADPGRTTPLALQPHVAPVAQRATQLQARAVDWKARAPDAQAGTRVHDAILALLPHLSQLGAPPPPPPAAPQAFGAELRATLLAGLDPAETVAAALRARIHVDGATPAALEAEGVPSVRDVLVQPRFERPMYEALRETMPDLLLPGADGLPADTVTVLETNPQFIQAFLAGLNHEMSRELLWRGFPADPRRSFFLSFWSEAADVPEAYEWPASARLGAAVSDGRVAGDLVLVIRGALLRRFPGTAVYAARAAADGGLAGTELHPLHRGELGTDAVFLLFRLTRAQAIGGAAGDGGPGWYFVFQEQPTAQRFGLNEPDGSEAPASWDAVTWDHVAVSPGGYLRVEESRAGVGALPGEDAPAWGFNGAHMAQVTRQLPFRVAIHARRLL